MSTNPTSMALLRLDDPDRDVRQEAALALGTQGDPANAETLVEHVFVESDPFVRETLTWAVVRVGCPILPYVRAGLVEPTRRLQALHIVSKLGTLAGDEDLRPHLEDPDPAVVGKTAWALAQIGGAEAVPALTAKLGRGENEQRNSLTSALSSFGADAVAEVAAALTDPDAAVRRHAADVLCFIGEPADAAVPELAMATADADPDVRIAVLMALSAIDSDGARAAIDAARESDDPRTAELAARLETDRLR